MGRTSKFTFPVPGRKQKPPFGPIVSGPMSKAQKILGTAEINIDAPRQWDTASNSGISVSVSESTATYNTGERSRAPAPAPAPRREEEGPSGNGSRRSTQWEQESEIVPAFLANRFSQLHTADGGGGGGQRDFTETSSLTRRGSNSTITSWYDKAKMPLSISQQTSSSAMAKGLPQKANAVLDIQGKESNHMTSSCPKAKRRPSRLDLADLLSRHKHHSLIKGKTDTRSSLGPDHNNNNNNRPPSLASISSPRVTPMPPPPPPPPPPIQQRSERKLTRKNTFDSINSVGGRPRTGSSSRRGASDISNLPNLYEHYEQMSFDQVLGHDGPLAASGPSPACAGYTPLRSPSATDQKKALTRPPLRHEGASSSAYQTHYGALPEPPKPAGQPSMQTDRDCASSVSSRYTKTSKASKRTSQSLSGSDLMEKSVLSLSSDSEDDFFPDSVSKFTGGSRSSDAGSLAPSSLRSTHSRDAPSPGQGSRKSAKRASFAPTNTYYLTISSKSPPGKPPVVNPRLSSLPSTAYQPPSSSNRLSRYSTTSSSTTYSVGDRPIRPPAYGGHDSRASSFPPSSESYSTADRGQLPQRMLSTKSSSVHSVDQPTPPMSPTSVESFMASGGSADAHGTTDSRFMAVTRQEEMLLAALRMKRARMRESVIAEYDDEVPTIPSSYHQRNSSQGTITDMEWPEPPQTLRHQSSTTSNSTIKAGSCTHDGRPVSSAPGKKTLQRNGSRHPNPGAPSSQPTSVMPPSRAGSVKKMMPVQEAIQAGAKQERILLYLDRPVGNVNSMDFAEPSPDLSDFMDFDNGSDDEDELSSDMGPFRGRDSRYAMSTKNRGQVLRTGERARHEPSPLRPRGEVAGTGTERVRVAGTDRDVDSRCGIPRPDSPVSPEGTLGLPNKSLSKKKAVRLSAVGNTGVEAAWWGDDG
ncbi:hypothetical protein CSHISOI_06245 [Colletotrichum shisoi]|uniref:Uncharacterized protein n=1 Tax=Colletotrichum shisoi TaxID=2078593 RepID=A0A5Q4BRB8_9PEZI|nr:hypothetical protein CSHISOI_06245 [Colletotrichum shisoi]